MTPPLVLSLFPGLDGFGMGFEMEGFCVVAGPDLQWGRRVEDFHPTPGRFDGVIGGPPCQRFSPLANLVRHVRGEAALAPNLIPEFERCVAEAEPVWFAMENSPFAPVPNVPGYVVHDVVLNNRWFADEPGVGIGQVQQRKRRFSFGTRYGARLIFDVAAFEHPKWERAVLASESHASRVPYNPRGVKGPNRFPTHALEQAPFTVEGAYRLVGNAVPIPMARAVARAVKRAMGYETEAGS